MNPLQLRRRCGEQLLAGASRVSDFKAFIGLDGFVDEIIHVVDKRESCEIFHRLPTIARLAERILGAAGRSTNIELVNQRTKLGGNGPIMADALAQFGMKVTYLGALGYPTIHPVFAGFARRAQVYSIAEPGHTDALEFEDGKVMLGKSFHLKEVNWENIQKRFGREKFAQVFTSADLVGFVNWTMLPYMSQVWEAIFQELGSELSAPRRLLFFDLADPQKRSIKDITRALELVSQFEKYFDVILGLNEKEAFEIGQVLGLDLADHSTEGVGSLAREVNRILAVNTVVIHPVAFAIASSNGMIDLVEGPHVSQPLITTGAGDHFNAGFCLGRLLGFGNAMSLLTAVSSSGYYVRTGQSPSLSKLAAMLQDWPEKLC